jgi:hypothetical protein
MLHLSKSFAAAAAMAAAVVAFSSPADACSEIGDAALDNVAAGTPLSYGAPFFTDSVKDAFGFSSSYIATLWGSYSPSSPLYYSHILAGNWFMQIPGITTSDGTTSDNIQAGDVMVINSTTGYNGHTVVIIGTPTVISPQINPIVADTVQWAVPIADSTSTSHGCNPAYPDSRWSGPCAGGTFTPGIGTGTIRVYTDVTTGDTVGYTWSVTSSLTSFYSMAARPYALARVTPCPPAG